MKQKLKKQMEICSSEEVLSPPSPHSRHEKWKMTRIKEGGQMMSEKSQMIAQQIVSYYRNDVEDLIICSNLYYE